MLLKFRNTVHHTQPINPVFDPVMVNQIFFEHPEACIVDMRKHQATSANRQHHQVWIGMCLNKQGLNNSCGRKTCYGGGSYSYADDSSHQPSQDQWRKRKIVHHVCNELA